MKKAVILIGLVMFLFSCATTKPIVPPEPPVIEQKQVKKDIPFKAADNWYIANQIDLSWDAVTHLPNGDAIPEEDTIKYQIFLVEDGADKANDALLVATVETIPYTITMQWDGDYYAGVKAQRFIPAYPDDPVSESVIAWSDDAQYCQNGSTFGIRFYYPPDISNFNMRTGS